MTPAVCNLPRKPIDDYDDDSDDEANFVAEPTSSRSSTSSSLLAFETLERHLEDNYRTSSSSLSAYDTQERRCEDDFRTSASADPFGWRSSDSTSWRFAGNPTDPLPTSSSSSSSSDDTLHLSLSSSTSYRSSLTNDSRLRAYRSFDSLNLFDSGASLSCSAADLSLSHNALDLEKEKERDQEEFVLRDKKLTATTANLSTMMDSPPELARGKLARASFHSIPNRRDRKAASTEVLRPPAAQHRASEPCLAPAPQQSAENLSEDSGFCDSRSTQVLPVTPDSSDCSGGEETVQRRLQISEIERGSEPADDDDPTNFSYGAPRVGRCRQFAPCSDRDNAHSFLAELAAAPTSDRSDHPPPRLSTFCDNTKPYFSTFQKTEDQNPSGYLFQESWDVVTGMAGRLPAVSAPNLYLGDDASLTHVPLKAGDDDSPRSRGVTFCPVVSEVSWRNSYSDSESVESSQASTDEMSNRSLEDLCMGDEEDEEEVEVEEKSVPSLDVGMRSDLSEHEDVQAVNGDSSSVETQLVPPTRLATPSVFSHVVSSDAEIPNAGRISTVLPVREVHSSDDEVSPCAVTVQSAMAEKKGLGKSRFGGFFERFSFRRLSSRVSGKKSKKKSDGVDRETVSVGVATAPLYEDVTIISLHAPEVETVVAPSGLGGKPPLPPRVPGAARKPPPDVMTGTVSSGLRDGSRMPGVRGPTAIYSSGPGDRVLPRPLETDLDALEPLEPEPERREGKKARSLMNLGLGEVTAPRPSLSAIGKPPSEDRARSMEFLLDKENQAAIMVSE